MSGSRLLIVNDSLGLGGAERQMALLATNLPPEWPCVVWSHAGGAFAGALEAAGLPVEIAHRKGRSDWRSLASPIAAVRRHRPSVVMSWGWLASTVLGPACKSLGVPLVSNIIRTGSATLRSRIQAQWIEQFDAYVLGNTEAGLRAHHIGEEKGRVVRNGFDARRLAAVIGPRASRPRPKETRLHAIMTARIDSAKDHGTLIGAAAILEALHPGRWRFTIVGSGPLREQWMELVRTMGLGQCVSFVPAEADVIPRVAVADVGVLLTGTDLSEGCSNSILEYMACGLPVVATDCPGNRELLRGCKAGVLVTPRRAIEVADALSAFARDPRGATAMAEADRQRVLTEYSVESMVARTVDILTAAEGGYA